MEVVECPANYDDYYNYQTGKCSTSAVAKLPTSLTMSLVSPIGTSCIQAGTSFQVAGSLTYVTTSTGATQTMPIPGQSITFSVTPLPPATTPIALGSQTTGSSGQYVAGLTAPHESWHYKLIGQFGGSATYQSSNAAISLSVTPRTGGGDSSIKQSTTLSSSPMLV